MIRLLETQCPAEHKGRCNARCLPGCSVQHRTREQNPALHREAGECRHLPCKLRLRHTVQHRAWLPHARQGCTVQEHPAGCRHGGVWCSPRLSVRSAQRACHVWHQRANASVALLRTRYLVQSRLPSPEAPCHRQYGIAVGQSVAIC